MQHLTLQKTSVSLNFFTCSTHGSQTDTSSAHLSGALQSQGSLKALPDATQQGSLNALFDATQLSSVVTATEPGATHISPADQTPLLGLPQLDTTVQLHQGRLSSPSPACLVCQRDAVKHEVSPGSPLTAYAVPTTGLFPPSYEFLAPRGDAVKHEVSPEVQLEAYAGTLAMAAMQQPAKEPQAGTDHRGLSQNSVPAPPHSE